jgi:hypothetical protein
MTAVAAILLAPWLLVLGFAVWLAYKKWEQYYG